MEPDLSGRFLPVYLGAKGLKGKYLASRKDFENLEQYTEGLIRTMSDRLRQGEISPDPYADGNFQPCQYCDYRQICGHEARDGFRSIARPLWRILRPLVQPERGKTNDLSYQKNDLPEPVSVCGVCGCVAVALGGNGHRNRNRRFLFAGELFWLQQ